MAGFSADDVRRAKEAIEVLSSLTSSSSATAGPLLLNLIQGPELVGLTQKVRLTLCREYFVAV